MRVSRLFVLLALVVFASMAAAPALAYGAYASNYGVSYDSTLTNDFGLAFAGQGKCIQCHSFSEFGDTYHGDFARPSLIPSAPAGWTEFRAAGDIAPVAGTAPVQFTKGGHYATSLGWITLGAYKTGATEYIFHNPGADPTGKSWFNLVEGLIAEPGGIWEVGAEAPTTGLYDVKYGCGACHMLGYQDAAADGTINPNTHFTSQATSVTPSAWARVPGADKSVFNSWVPGLGIACENCHGTGVAAATGAHMGTGVKIVGADSIGKANSIIDSQVCGQCHGAGGKKVAALSRATVGYTPDQRLTNWLDLYAVSGGIQTFVAIPTEASFTANPSAYKYYPNGANYNLGSHMYYTEWATTAHSYRGQYTSASPDALPFQQAGNGHFNAKTLTNINCAKCHTGEGYLVRKGADIAEAAVLSTSTVGFAGQECVTCHTGHPGAEGIPGGQELLRAPEPGNNSVCEDCHNWQSEVMGTVVTPVASGRAVSHPTREIYNGRGMFEIPAAAAFMPGVKCEECHAVMANKSMNRPTHSFKPMLPGDAERWSHLSGVVVGQDSCTVCHVESRDALQAYIDTWQDDAAALSAQLTTEITAAKARPEFTASATGTVANYLVAVGYTNQYFYTGEGSSGAHNPPYIQAGLEKGLQLTKSVGGSFALVSAPSAPVAASTMNAIAGKIVNGDGSGAAGGTLTLLVGGSPVGTTVSDAGGNFAFTVAPAATTTYVVRWDRSSNATTQLMSAPKTITVGAMPTTITIRTSTTSVLLNGTFTLSGAVTPVGLVGQNMHVDVKKPGRSFYSYSSARTIYASGGLALWLYKYTPRLIRGTYLFKAVYDGDATYGASTSPTLVSVRVR